MNYNRHEGVAVCNKNDVGGFLIKHMDANHMEAIRQIPMCLFLVFLFFCAPIERAGAGRSSFAEKYRVRKTNCAQRHVALMQAPAKLRSLNQSIKFIAATIYNLSGRLNVRPREFCSSRQSLVSILRQFFFPRPTQG